MKTKKRKAKKKKKKESCHKAKLNFENHKPCQKQLNLKIKQTVQKKMNFMWIGLQKIIKNP